MYYYFKFCYPSTPISQLASEEINNTLISLGYTWDNISDTDTLLYNGNDSFCLFATIVYMAAEKYNVLISSHKKITS